MAVLSNLKSSHGAVYDTSVSKSSASNKGVRVQVVEIEGESRGGRHESRGMGGKDINVQGFQRVDCVRLQGNVY